MIERGDGHERLEPHEPAQPDLMALGPEQHCLPRTARAGEKSAVGRNCPMPAKRLVLAAREGREDGGGMAG
jgi:hypothetical protein